MTRLGPRDRLENHQCLSLAAAIRCRDWEWFQGRRRHRRPCGAQQAQTCRHGLHATYLVICWPERVPNKDGPLPKMPNLCEQTNADDHVQDHVCHRTCCLCYWTYIYWTEASHRTYRRIGQLFERINGVLYVPPTNDSLNRDKREVIYILTL